MKIRLLNDNDMPAAMRIKIDCFPDELAGFCSIELSYEKELEFWTHWASHAAENDDVRILYGAFDDAGTLIGVAFGSFVDSLSKPEFGIELNGLWVDKNSRGEGVSLHLLARLLDDFLALGANTVTIYNYRHSYSNSYYRHFGCTEIAHEFQTKFNIPTDIFQCDISTMRENIEAAIFRRNN